MSKQRPAVKDKLRKEVEDDLVFKASDVSLSSRQLWSMTVKGDSCNVYKCFKGWSEASVRSYLVSHGLKLIFEVAFLLFRIGVPEKKVHDVIETSFAREMVTRPSKNMGID